MSHNPFLLELITLSKNLQIDIIFDDSNNDFRLVNPIYNYHSLYVDNNYLCGNYNVFLDEKCFGITTFEIPIIKDKKLSKELIRFIKRSLNLSFLIKNIKPLFFRRGYLIDILLKDKKIPSLFKKHFKNMEILG